MLDGWRHTVQDAQGLVTLYARLGEMPQPFNVVVKHGVGTGRSISQNGLFHAWMGQIAKATHDDPGSVKAECHIRWGIPILRAEDEAYSDFIAAALGGRHRDQVKRMIEAGYIPCTRVMSKPVLSRYMDAIWRHYAPHVRLMDPEELKWREAE
jgi:hypothetical protein